MKGKFRQAYPIVISKEKDGYYVDIPDFGIATQGTDIADCLKMARDAIGLVGIDMIDEGIELPTPGTVEVEKNTDDILNYVDVDFEEYRQEIDSRAVRKNCTIPYWLNAKAEKMGLNFSNILQEALLDKINL